MYYKDKTVTLNFRISEADANDVLTLANFYGVSQSEMLRIIVTYFLVKKGLKGDET